MSEQSDIWIQKLNQIHAKLNAIGAGLSEEPLKDMHFEKEYYAAFPTSDRDDPAFGEKFLSLVRGLDEESVRSVVLSLKRLKAMKESDERILPFYTLGEQRAVRERLFAFEREIMRISGNRFSPLCAFFGASTEAKPAQWLFSLPSMAILYIVSSPRQQSQTSGFWAWTSSMTRICCSSDSGLMRSSAPAVRWL